MTEGATTYVALKDEELAHLPRKMAPVPPTLIFGIAMAIFATAASLVSMTLTLSAIVTKPGDGVNCYDDLPCAATHTCSPQDCIGQQGVPGVRGPQGIQGPPGTCSCNATGIITDASVAPNANISRSKLATGIPNWVVINDNSGLFSSERWLSTTRGGTGFDSSVSNGTVKISNGVWSSAPIVNNDVSPVAAISRAKLATGTAQQVLINDALGVMTSEAQLSPLRGGTGIDTTGLTGFAQVTSGTWFIGSVSISSLSGVPNSVVVVNEFGQLTNQSQLSTSLGGTGFDSSSSTGVVKTLAGTWSTSLISNIDVNASAAIARTKLACGTPYSIIVNDQNGCFAEQATLNATLGGTGINSAASTGIPHVLVGVWSVSQIVNNDIASTAAINRQKLATGTANGVVINDMLGFMTDEQFLSSSRGGTGLDSSAENGFAFVNGGTWSFVPGITNSSSGIISASGVFSPFLAYTGPELDIIDSAANGSICLKANGTLGGEHVCVIIGNTTVANFNINGLNLPTLAPGEAVVTDATGELASLAYTALNTPSTIVERDFSGAFATGSINVVTLLSTSAGTAVSQKNHYVLKNGLTIRFAQGLIGTESGSNAGSNFFVDYYDDSGTRLGTAILVTRATGLVSIPTLTASKAVVTDASNNLASMTFASTSTASTIMSRDASSNTAINQLTASTITNSGTLTLTSTASDVQITANAGNLNVPATVRRSGTITIKTITTGDLILQPVSGLINAATANITAIGAQLSSIAINTAVVTDGSHNLVSMVFTPTATASTLVSRDTQGGANFLKSTITDLSVLDNVTLTNVATAPLGDVTILTLDDFHHIESMNGAVTNEPNSVVVRDDTGSISVLSINVTGLTPNEAVVTDSNAMLISMVYTNLATASTLMSRDGSANSALNQLTTVAGTSVSGTVHSFLSTSTPTARFAVGLQHTEVLGNGSDYTIWRYNDSGSQIDAPLQISRFDGSTTLSKLVTNSIVPTASGTLVLTPNTGTQVLVNGDFELLGSHVLFTNNIEATSGGTVTVTQSNLVVSGGAGGALTLSKSVTTQAGTNGLGVAHWLIDNGASTRWTLGLINTESGSNAGSDLFWSRTNDSGSTIGTWLQVTRSTGQATFSSNIASTSATTGTVVITGGLGLTGTVNTPTVNHDSGDLTISTTTSGNVNINPVVNINLQKTTVTQLIQPDVTATRDVGTNTVLYRSAFFSGTVNAGGVNFGGTILSTYSIGTFTPTITFGGTATGLTYTRQAGVWTKIGRIVTFQINLTINSMGTGNVGTASIQTLPFAMPGGTFLQNFVVLPVLISFSGTVVAYCSGGTSNIVFQDQTSGTGGTLLTDANFVGGASMHINGQYFASS